MEVIDAQGIQPKTVEEVAQTNAANDDALASASSAAERWQEFIDNTLIEWGRAPQMIEDDGILPPSPRALHVAAVLAIELRKKGLPPPLRIVPDGDGGVVFERRTENGMISIAIDLDGSIEHLLFRNGQLQFRRTLEVLG